MARSTRFENQRNLYGFLAFGQAVSGRITELAPRDVTDVVWVAGLRALGMRERAAYIVFRCFWWFVGGFG